MPTGTQQQSRPRASRKGAVTKIGVTCSEAVRGQLRDAWGISHDNGPSYILRHHLDRGLKTHVEELSELGVVLGALTVRPDGTRRHVVAKHQEVGPETLDLRQRPSPKAKQDSAGPCPKSGTSRDELHPGLTR